MGTVPALFLLLLAPQIQWRVETAPEWNAMFDRTSGWTGADGIYSIPLDGDDRIASWHGSGTVFVFGDTFIGEVDSRGHRLPGTTLVNNTLAWLPAGAGPDPGKIHFDWGDDHGSPTAVFIPNTPHATPDQWYWFKDGITIGGTLHLFAARMSKKVAPFHREGISLISVPVDERPPFPTAVQRETPFWSAETPTRGQIAYGGAILDNSAVAGAPHPDGFVYVYGIQEDPRNKKVIVARVLRTDFQDFGSWRFWNGSGWSSVLADSKPLCDRTSTEMSVTPLPDGRFLMVFMLDTISGKIALRWAPAPTGPWSDFTVVYTVPAPPPPPSWMVYHAKAHPQLSDPGELLISYNVNALGGFGDHFTWADIYRPRFIRLILH